MEYVNKSFKFNFKKRTIKDENGQTIGEIAKKPSIEVALPVLSTAGVIEALQAGGKEAEVILDAVNFVFYQAARQQFDDVIENMTNPDDEEIGRAHV